MMRGAAMTEQRSGTPDAIRCDECGDTTWRAGLCRGCRHFRELMRLETIIRLAADQTTDPEVRTMLLEAIEGEP